MFRPVRQVAAPTAKSVVSDRILFSVTCESEYEFSEQHLYEDL